MNPQSKLFSKTCGVLALFIGLMPSMHAFMDGMELTPANISQTQGMFSLKVMKTMVNSPDLISIEIHLTQSAPRHMNSNFTLKHNRKVIAVNGLGFISHKGDNSFRLALAPENLAESTFTIIDAGLDTPNWITGSATGYTFRLGEFVPASLLTAPNGTTLSYPTVTPQATTPAATPVATTGKSAKGVESR